MGDAALTCGSSGDVVCRRAVRVVLARAAERSAWCWGVLASGRSGDAAC
jgi:hypothetical protein